MTTLAAILLASCGTGQRDTGAEPANDANDAAGTDDSDARQDPNDARITVPASYRGAGQRLHNVGPDTVRVLSTTGVAAICLDRPGRVTINEVVPETSAGEIRVEAFAFTPWRSSGNRSATPLPGGPVVLDRAAACVADDPHARNDAEALAGLQLRVRKVGHQTATAEQLVLRYTSGGHPYEFSMRYSIALCAPDDPTTRECQPVG
ncbi:hypothetical protein EAD89_16730 [Micromonospora sp. BL4]|nr:hypothetical protein EAD89_16730 [Micromonospora sp. BL4]